MSDIHPAHLENKFRQAQRLSNYFYANRHPASFVEQAGERFWIGQCKLAGEKIRRVRGKEVPPSESTRELTVSMLKDLEASGAVRGPSLEEIAEERVTSSWGNASSDTVSDGPGPSPKRTSTPPDVGPSEDSEAPRPHSADAAAAPTTTASAGASNGLTTPASAAASDDARPPAGTRLSESPRGGQVSLPFQPHSETSWLAAHDQDTKDVAAAHRLLVLQTLRELGPLTDDQIADHLGLTTEQVRIRRIGLMHDRIVEQAGRGLSRKGRPCNTWGLTELAVSA